jgi:pimeloyl-ACP methyl ester carboxylesterase
VNAADAHADDGSLEFFTSDPDEMFKQMSDSVAAPLGPNPGGSASVRADAGGAAGLKDVVDGIVGAARRLANFTTYYQMKERAGIVGRTGLNQVLRRLRQHNPAIRLHLVGHSFGARLVTAAADALDANTSAVTLTLLQAAYSHNGLAQKFDGQNDGFFRKLISNNRVSGPIIITHTKNDAAVGIAYPLASRLSHTKAAAIGDENDPYGGLGRNGAQRTPEAKGLALALADLPAQQPGPYKFVSGKVYNLKADKFIRDHNDICKHEVAYAMLKAAAQI